MASSSKVVYYLYNIETGIDESRITVTLMPYKDATSPPLHVVGVNRLLMQITTLFCQIESLHNLIEHHLNGWNIMD
jgi:hypothetical protein